METLLLSCLIRCNNEELLTERIFVIDRTVKKAIHFKVFVFFLQGPVSFTSLAASVVNIILTNNTKFLLSMRLRLKNF